MNILETPVCRNVEILNDRTVLDVVSGAMWLLKTIPTADIHIHVDSGVLKIYIHLFLTY